MASIFHNLQIKQNLIHIILGCFNFSSNFPLLLYFLNWNMKYQTHLWHFKQNLFLLILLSRRLHYLLLPWCLSQVSFQLYVISFVFHTLPQTTSPFLGILSSFIPYIHTQTNSYAYMHILKAKICIYGSPGNTCHIHQHFCKWLFFTVEENSIVCELHFYSPFVYRWAFRLVLSHSYCEQSSNKHGCSSITGFGYKVLLTFVQRWPSQVKWQLLF